MGIEFSTGHLQINVKKYVSFEVAVLDTTQKNVGGKNSAISHSFEINQLLTCANLENLLLDLNYLCISKTRGVILLVFLEL